ncbi:MAG: hypothetical protein KC505_06410 [Myxococcales bacterium]|nr:hypothetical protein [Myxococcales bacterium]
MNKKFLIKIFIFVFSFAVGKTAFSLQHAHEKFLELNFQVEKNSEKIILDFEKAEIAESLIENPRIKINFLLADQAVASLSKHEDGYLHFKSSHNGSIDLENFPKNKGLRVESSADIFFKNPLSLVHGSFSIEGQCQFEQGVQQEENSQLMLEKGQYRLLDESKLGFENIGDDVSVDFDLGSKVRAKHFFCGEVNSGNVLFNKSVHLLKNSGDLHVDALVGYFKNLQLHPKSKTLFKKTFIKTDNFINKGQTHLGHGVFEAQKIENLGKLNVDEMEFAVDNFVNKSLLGARIFKQSRGNFLNQNNVKISDSFFGNFTVFKDQGQTEILGVGHIAAADVYLINNQLKALVLLVNAKNMLQIFSKSQFTIFHHLNMASENNINFQGMLNLDLSVASDRQAVTSLSDKTKNIMRKLKRGATFSAKNDFIFAGKAQAKNHPLFFQAGQKFSQKPGSFLSAGGFEKNSIKISSKDIFLDGNSHSYSNLFLFSEAINLSGNIQTEKLLMFSKEDFEQFECSQIFANQIMLQGKDAKFSGLIDVKAKNPSKQGHIAIRLDNDLTFLGTISCDGMLQSQCRSLIHDKSAYTQAMSFVSEAYNTKIGGSIVSQNMSFISEQDVTFDSSARIMSEQLSVKTQEASHQSGSKIVSKTNFEEANKIITEENSIISCDTSIMIGHDLITLSGEISCENSQISCDKKIKLEKTARLNAKHLNKIIGKHLHNRGDISGKNIDIDLKGIFLNRGNIQSENNTNVDAAVIVNALGGDINSDGNIQFNSDYLNVAFLSNTSAAKNLEINTLINLSLLAKNNGTDSFTINASAMNLSLLTLNQSNYLQVNSLINVSDLSFIMMKPIALALPSLNPKTWWKEEKSWYQQPLLLSALKNGFFIAGGVVSGGVTGHVIQGVQIAMGIINIGGTLYQIMTGPLMPEGKQFRPAFVHRKIGQGINLGMTAAKTTQLFSSFVQGLATKSSTNFSLSKENLVTSALAVIGPTVSVNSLVDLSGPVSGLDLVMSGKVYRNSIFSLDEGQSFAATKSVLTRYGYSSSTDVVINNNICGAHKLCLEGKKYAAMGFTATANNKLDDNANIHAGHHINLTSEHGDILLNNDAQFDSPNNHVSAPRGSIDIYQRFLANYQSGNYSFLAENIHSDGKFDDAETLVFDVKRNLDISKHAVLGGENFSITIKEGEMSLSPDAKVDFANTTLRAQKIKDISHLVAQEGLYKNFHVSNDFKIFSDGDEVLTQSIKGIPSGSLLIDARSIDVENHVQLKALNEMILHAKEGKVILGEGVRIKGDVYTEVDGRLGVFCKYGQENIRYNNDKRLSGQIEKYIFSPVVIEGGQGRQYEYTDPLSGEINQRKIGLRVISEEGKITGTGTKFESSSSDTMIFAKEGYDNQGLALYYVAGYEKHKGHRYFNYGTQFLEGSISGDKILLLSADGQIHQTAGYLKAGDGGIVTSAQGDITSIALQGYQGNSRNNYTLWSTLKETATAGTIIWSSKEGKVDFPGIVLDAPNSTLVLDAKVVDLQELPIFDVRHSSKHKFSLEIPHSSKKKKGVIKKLVARTKDLINTRVSFDQVDKKQSITRPGPGAMRVGGLVDIAGGSLNLHDGYSIIVGDSRLELDLVTQTPFESSVKTQSRKKGLHLGFNHVNPKIGAHFEQSESKSTTYIPSSFIVSGQLSGHVNDWQQDHSLLFAHESAMNIDSFSSHMRQNISKTSFEKLEINMNPLNLAASVGPIVEVSFQKTIKPITTRVNGKAPVGLFIENAKDGFYLASAQLQGAKLKINHLSENTHVGPTTHLKMPNELHNQGAIAGLSFSTDALGNYFPDSASGFLTVLDNGHSFSFSSDIVQGGHHGFGIGVDEFSASFDLKKQSHSVRLSSLMYEGFSVPTSKQDISRRISEVKHSFDHVIDFVGKSSDYFSEILALFSGESVFDEKSHLKEDKEKPLAQTKIIKTKRVNNKLGTTLQKTKLQNPQENENAKQSIFPGGFCSSEEQQLINYFFHVANSEMLNNSPQEQDQEKEIWFSELCERAHQYFNSHQGVREGSHLYHTLFSLEGEKIIASESASKAFLATLLARSRLLKRQEFSEPETSEHVLNKELFEKIEKLDKPVLWTFENEEQVAFPYRVKGTNYYLENSSQIDSVLGADEILKTSPSKYVKQSYESIKSDEGLPILFFDRETLGDSSGFFNNDSALEGQRASSKDVSQIFGKKVIAIASAQENLEYTAATIGHEGFHHFWNRYFVGGTPGFDGTEESFEKASHKLIEAYAKDFHALGIYKDISNIPQSDQLNRTLFFKPWQYFAHKYIDGLIDYQLVEPAELNIIKQEELLLPLEKALLSNNPEGLILSNDRLFPSLLGQEAFMQEIPTHMLEADFLTPKSTEFYSPNMRQALEDILAAHPDFSPQFREKAHDVLSSLETIELNDKSWLGYLKSEGYALVGKSVLKSLPYIDFAAHYGIERLEGYDSYQALGRGSVRFGTDFAVYSSIFGAMAHFLGGGITLGAAAASVAGEFLPEYSEQDYQRSLDRMKEYSNEGALTASMVEYNYFSYMANTHILKKILTAPHEFSAWTFDKIDEKLPQIIKTISVSSRFLIKFLKESDLFIDNSGTLLPQESKLKSLHEIYAQALAEEDIARAKHVPHGHKHEH